MVSFRLCWDQSSTEGKLVLQRMSKQETLFEKKTFLIGLLKVLLGNTYIDFTWKQHLFRLTSTDTIIITSFSKST